jgi:hypothetical protein
MSEEAAINNNEIANTVPEFKCETCGRQFGNALGLKIHLNTHKPKPKRRLLPRRKAAPIKTTPPDYPREALKTEEQKKKSNEPWRPASILTSSKLPGMRPRWVRKDVLEKRIEEGWQPRLSESKSRVESPEKTIVDGIPLGRYVTKRNLVLCDMPEELAMSREDYFRHMNDTSMKGQKQQYVNETVVGGESRSYGDVQVEKG